MMALNVWTKNSGYSLGTFPESLAVSQQLNMPLTRQDLDTK